MTANQTSKISPDLKGSLSLSLSLSHLFLSLSLSLTSSAFISRPQSLPAVIYFYRNSRTRKTWTLSFERKQ